MIFSKLFFSVDSCSSNFFCWFGMFLILWDNIRCSPKYWNPHRKSFLPVPKSQKTYMEMSLSKQIWPTGQGMGTLGWPPLIVCEKQFIICRWWVRWGIDGFQGERKKDQSSLIKNISVLNNIGCKFPANEWVFLKILRSLIRGWGGEV